MVGVITADVFIVAIVVNMFDVGVFVVLTFAGVISQAIVFVYSFIVFDRAVAFVVCAVIKGSI